MARHLASSCVLVSVVLAFAACHTTPRPAVDVIEHFDVRYAARMDGTPFTPSTTASDETPRSGEPLSLQSELFTMPHDVANALLCQGRFGSATGIGLDCARVPARGLRSAIDELVAAGVATSIATHALPSTLGSSTVVDRVAQYAYIAAFDVKATNQAFVGDPVVEVAHEGLSLTVRPERDGEQFALDLDVRSAELLRPVPIATDTLIARTAPISIQVPALFHQTVGARALLRPSDAVCLVWPGSPSSGDVTMMVIECAAPPQFAAATIGTPSRAVMAAR